MKEALLIIAASAALFCSCKQNVPQPVKLADYLWEISVDDYTSEVPNYLKGQVGRELAAKTLWLTIHEDYDHIYKFSL